MEVFINGTLYYWLGGLCLMGLILCFATKRRNEAVIVEWKDAVIKEERDPLQDFADEMGIPIAEVKVSLGLPVIISTVRDSIAAYEAFSIADSDTEEEYAALVRWYETEDEICYMQELYKEAKSYRSLRIKIRDKWNTMSLEEMSKAKTKEEFLEVFGNCSPDLRPMAVRKMYPLFVQ